ncbi:hypothetical protein VZT92_011547 [Zoarces viviparus]|uniref:chitinase n=1 Tax=Zoarces viviparus TaxID=48416 RepID=A0AAW1F508_ZOAVI
MLCGIGGTREHLYGRAFDLSTASTGVGAPANGPGEEGCYTGEEGFWAYYETCLYIEGTTTQLIVDQEVPYAVTENQWVGFDNEASLDTKVNYLKTNNFGGACVWSLDLDDTTGKFCKMGKCPFISHLHDILVPDFPSFSTTTPPTTTMPTTTTSTGTPCDGKSSGHFPFPGDPTKYYQCDSLDRVHILQCGSNTVFNEAIETCVHS